MISIIQNIGGQRICRCILLRLLKTDLLSVAFSTSKSLSRFHETVSPLDVANKQLQKPQDLQVGNLRHRETTIFPASLSQ